MDKQICNKCEIEFPLNNKFFALAHGSSDRFVTICRECRKEYNREYQINTREEVISEMFTIKEEPIEAKRHRMHKAFNYIHLQAFGEQMTENIYWCKKDDHVQVTDEVCSKCDKTMEKIGFIDYNEDDK